MLSVSQLHVAYGQSEALHGVSVDVAPNEIVAIMGRNGMGKTTLMKAMMGLLPTRSGSIRLEEHDLTKLKSYERVARGLGYVPQGRMIFGSMTVEENIRTGLAVRDSSEVSSDVYELFPVLLEMRDGGAVTCPAASSSSSPSPGRSRRSPRFCCSTSRRKASSPRSSRKWAAR